jgi:hypothetical protein
MAQRWPVIEEVPEVSMGKVLPFPSERAIAPASPPSSSGSREALADLFDDPMTEATVAQAPWFEEPIDPQPVIPVGVPALPREGFSANTLPPLPASFALPPSFESPRTPPSQVIWPPPLPASTVILSPPPQSPRSAPPLYSAYYPPPPPARMEVVPAAAPWAHALVAVVLTLAQLIPAIAVVAYFAVRTGDAPLVIPPASTTPAP